MIISAAESTAQDVREDDWNIPVTAISKDTLNGALFICGEVYIPETRELIWNVLTDYDNLKTFIPGMLESSVLSSSDSVKIIFQKGRSRFLIFSKTIEVKLRVREHEPQDIEFDLEEGPFQMYYGSWILTKSDNPRVTLLAYQATVKPDFFSLKFLINRVMRNEFRNSLEAIRKEVKRRKLK